MVKEGDKFKEKMVPFPGKFFSWEIKVKGIYEDNLGFFAQCIRTHSDGKIDNVDISIDLLEEQVFYKKIA